MARKKYLRKNTKDYSRLGKGRKKLQRWRRPKGRDNKLRERKKSRPTRPELGSKKPIREQGKIQGKNPILIKNLSDLKKLTKDNIAVLARVGKKNKIKIAEEAKKQNITFANLDLFKFLKSIQKTKEKQSEEKPKSNTNSKGNGGSGSTGDKK